MPSPKFSGPAGMRFFRSEVESPDLRNFLTNIEQPVDQTVQDVLEFVRLDVLRYLRAYTNHMSPPDYRVIYYGGDPKAPRPTHPGGWADISGALRKGYHTEVVRSVDGRGWTLKLWNDAIDEGGKLQNLAATIEAKFGFFVVTGVMDPGGPVMWSINRAIRRLAPTWRVSGILVESVTVEPVTEEVPP